MKKTMTRHDMKVEISKSLGPSDHMLRDLIFSSETQLPGNKRLKELLFYRHPELTLKYK